MVLVKKNIIYAELFGASGIGSFGFEREIIRGSYGYFNLKVGVGSSIRNTSWPINGINWYTRIEGSFFEVGLAMLKSDPSNKTFYRPRSMYSLASHVGFRFINKYNSVYRFFIAPVVHLEDPDKIAIIHNFFFTAGFSIGRQF